MAFRRQPVQSRSSPPKKDSVLSGVFGNVWMFEGAVAQIGRAYLGSSQL